MGMRVMMGVLGLGVLLTMSSVPSAWAADEDAAAEAASGEPVAVEFDREHILQEIEATRQTDPELAAEMESQLQLLDSGELDLADLTGARDAALTVPTSEGAVLSAPMLQGAGGLPSAELIGPPVEGTGGMPDYMTPELREQLFNVFDGVGRGELTEDQARGQAEAIMREHGIDPREMGQGHEGEWEQQDQGEWEQHGGGPMEGMERAFEQMSPEAREQMERFFEGSEGTSREFEGQAHEQMEREFETLQREYELAAPESPEREFESSQREYEAATREYEAPQHEYEAPEAPEAPEHEYEAPEGYEAPEHEYEMPEQQQYEAPPQP